MPATTKIQDATPLTHLVATHMIPIAATGDGEAYHLTGQGVYNAPIGGVLNVEDEGADPTGATDSTTFIQAAYDKAFAKTYGGKVFLPPGSYIITHLDLHHDTGEFSKSVSFVGAGPYATRLALNTTGVGIDLIGANHMHFEDMYITSGANAPSVGILLARSTTSTTAGNHSFKNVWVWGNFTLACVASLASENVTWTNCFFNNTNTSGGVAFFTSGYATGYKLNGAGAYTLFTVTSSHGTIHPDSNTNCEFFGCKFYGYGTNNIPLSIDASFAGAFYGCSFLPTSAGATSCVLISNYNATPFNGPVLFSGCLFEAGNATHGIELYVPSGSRSFYHIFLRDNYTHLYGSGQESVTYTGSPTLAAVYDFVYVGNTRSGTTTDSIKLDYAQWADISLPNGTLRSNNGFNDCKIHANVYDFLQSIELITWAKTTRELWATASPTTGVYFVGERVYNSAPAATEWIGWVATVQDGGAYGASRANSTNYAVGSWLKLAGGTVWEVTADAAAPNGLTGGSPPSEVGAIGATVVDGDLTLTKRSALATTLKGFGVIET